MEELPDSEAEFVQFVCFKTAGSVPADLFQQSWLSVAEECFSRGIKTIILSEKLPLSSDSSPSRFVAKNVWASLTAIKGSFSAGIPPPSSRGHIAVSQAGIFKLVHTVKGETKINHNSIYKTGFKVFTMIPCDAEPFTNDKFMAYTDYLRNINGFEALIGYKLHDISGPRKDWLYGWIIEAFYNSVNADEESVLPHLINCPIVAKQWEISVHKDYVQMVGEASI
ncbi:uncharacterized protein [Montipora capricornis]|uniref:uncharacterized protein n=1 Tax=Montipora capricornis TaxID=246305 RepID=UPI0035F19149